MKTNNGDTSTNDSINSIRRNLNLSKHDLWSMCPILLYQLSQPTPLERTGCVDENLLLSTHEHFDDDCFDCSESNRTLGTLISSIEYSIENNLKNFIGFSLYSLGVCIAVNHHCQFVWFVRCCCYSMHGTTILSTCVAILCGPRCRNLSR